MVFRSCKQHPSKLLLTWETPFVHHGSFCHGNMAPRIASRADLVLFLLVDFQEIVTCLSPPNLTAVRQSCACHIQQLLIATRRDAEF